MMKKLPIVCLLVLSYSFCSAQKVEGIYFNLYTDSLKKGFYNYINVDGKMSDGNWLPLDSNSIALSCNTGHFKGNDLFIDSSYRGDLVTVKAVLRKNPSIWKETSIYIRKRGFTEPLKTGDEIMYDTEKTKTQRKKKG